MQVNFSLKEAKTSMYNKLYLPVMDSVSRVLINTHTRNQSQDPKMKKNKIHPHAGMR
jgi:hypothetical protein